nr:glycoside hydrolase family 19 protein [uncultured Cohaesibacter sp.]
MNHKVFFNHVRLRLFKKLTQSQVDGINRLLDYAVEEGVPLEETAYVLATSYHETGRRMVPVREGFAKSDAAAIRAVTKLYNRGRISQNYALRDKRTGKSYFGRGDVQLTFYDNYKRLGKLLGIDLLNKPSLALDPKTSAIILFRGMREGLFTGKKLSFYINENKVDFKGARRVVNGTDKANLIAGYARIFLDALLDAGYTANPIVPDKGTRKVDDIDPEEEALLDSNWNIDRKPVKISTSPDWIKLAFNMVEKALDRWA